ncbi:hypothetical protein LTR53_011169 [Teratosphaeriaceae sp. CCFEE 6253]|nr:hypothetical protein LTR53_011169 [Teratosphaeriaceae sp. CCFEE 6253]
MPPGQQSLQERLQDEKAAGVSSTRTREVTMRAGEKRKRVEEESKQVEEKTKQAEEESRRAKEDSKQAEEETGGAQGGGGETGTTGRGEAPVGGQETVEAARPAVKSLSAQCAQDDGCKENCSGTDLEHIRRSRRHRGKDRQQLSDGSGPADGVAQRVAAGKNGNPETTLARYKGVIQEINAWIQTPDPEDDDSNAGDEE